SAATGHIAHEACDVDRPETSGVVPAHRGRFATIAARGHVVEVGRIMRRSILINKRCCKTEARIGGQRAGPNADEQRRSKTGTADLFTRTVHDHQRAGVGIGIERDVRHATRGMPRVLTYALLPARHRLEGAGAAAGTTPGAFAGPG